MKPYMSDLCFNAFKRVNISSSSKCSDLDSFRFAVGMFRGWGGRKVIIVFAGRGGGYEVGINSNLFTGNANS